MSELLRMEGITKHFPGVLALDRVSLGVRAGEVHALIGENGAGKSTLMKILSGAYSMDAGEIFLDGRAVSINTPRAAQELGISTIYQELNLVPRMSVAENISLSALPQKNPLKLSWNQIRSRAGELLSELGVNVDVNAKVSTLGIAQQQMVEIAKALNHKARLIIMDEPTSPLTENEAGRLFDTVHKLRREGVAIIYISHRLEEIMQIADRATIMRDGQIVKTVEVADSSINELIRAMVGHELSEQFPEREAEIGGIAFEVFNLSRKGLLNDISFSARSGEVLGICGLVGAGRTEMLRALFGVDPRDSGRVLVGGREVNTTRPRAAIDAKIGFVTEDRKSEGLMLIRDCKENISLIALSDFERFIHISKAAEVAACNDYVDKLRIKTPSLSQKARNLSGGNQQKIVLAKWLMSRAEVLFLDEPTRGIDVGAKVEVYNIINQIAAQGKTVIMVSSEMTELIGMCDRIIVICRGTVTGEVDKADFSQERLMYLAAGGDTFIKQNQEALTDATERP